MHECIVSPHYITKGVSVMRQSKFVMQADFDKLKKLAEDKRDGKVSEEEYSRRFYDAWSKTKKNRKVER